MHSLVSICGEVSFCLEKDFFPLSPPFSLSLSPSDFSMPEKAGFMLLKS